MRKTTPFLLAGLLIVIAVSSFRFQQALTNYAVVSADQMNVFYIGVDNPVSVSVPGIDADRLQVSLSRNGTISGSRGKYMVRVNGGTETNVNVDYTDAKGKLIEAPSYRFRIKRVPDPACYVGNIKGMGFMTKAEFQNIAGVFPRMENFDFDIRFMVQSFELSTYSDSAYVNLQANGPAFTAEMKSLIHKAEKDDRYFIENVLVKGPDGTIRKIPGVTIRIK